MCTPGTGLSLIHIYRDQLGAGYAVCDVAGVLIAQPADADDTDFQLFHRYALLYI